MVASLTEAEIRTGLEEVRSVSRALWFGDDGRLRRGRSGDLVTMLDDLGIPTVSVSVFERLDPKRGRAGR